MAQRPTHVPKFGNWDANDHAPYTRVFETARAGRGKLINPNDPAENPEMFAPTVAKPPPAPPKQQPDADARRPRQDRASKDEAEFRRYMESPARKQVAQSPGHHQLQPGRTTSSSDNQYQRRAQNGGESPYHRYAGDRSPLHPQARKVGSASPGPAINSVPSRSRTRSGRAEEPAVPTLPKFGEWDAKDPASGDGFTVIFNNARSEKQAGGAGRIPEMQVGMAPDNRNGLSARYPPGQKPSKNSNWFCCFS